MASSINLDIESPLARHLIRTHVGEQAIDFLTSTLGSGFTTYDESEAVPQSQRSWREVRCDLSEFKRLEEVIKALRNDITHTGVKHFMRIPYDLSSGPKDLTWKEASRFEKNGICIRVSIQIYPPPGLVAIDYIGWK